MTTEDDWSANENDRVKIKQPFLKNTARKTVISVGKRSSSFIRSDIQVTIQLIGNPSCIVSYLVFTLISLAREYNVIILGLDHAGKTVSSYGARKSEDDFYTITTGIKPVANHANDRSEPGMNHVVINISEVLGFRRIKGYPKDLGEILRRSGCYMLGNR
ncbi:hypothetical protein PSHT_06461 [Puccinia striiformis]|uniref:Uncharacterized protein n=1 Tax=Puccinia striiformis TaxID=27350 RepID=A0A2S4W5S9_9BASI|nr:hypothetical protein PSHT_06461 [Puccinia striiformis]